MTPTRSRSRRGPALAALLMLAACGDGADPSEADPPTTTAVSAVSSTSAEPPPTTATTAVPTTTVSPPSALQCAVSVTGDVTRELVGSDRIVTRELGPEGTVAFLTFICGSIEDPALRFRVEMMSATAAGFAAGPQTMEVLGRPEEGLEPGLARASIGLDGDAYRPVGGEVQFTRLEDTGYEGTIHIDGEQVGGDQGAPKRVRLDATFDFPCPDPTATFCT